MEWPYVLEVGIVLLKSGLNEGFIVCIDISARRMGAQAEPAR